MGPNSDNRVDYPDFAHKVARKVKINKNKAKPNQKSLKTKF